MNYDGKIAAGLRDLDEVRRFHECFPRAEHAIVQAKHDFEPDGWKVVDEWISRVRLYDRYALWLVVPIEVTASGAVSSLDQPTAYFVEVERVGKGNGGPGWECLFGQFEEEDWKELMDAGGDVEAAGLDLMTDAPVEGFDTFWHATCPPPEDPAPDGLALRAPLRFMSCPQP